MSDLVRLRLQYFKHRDHISLSQSVCGQVQNFERLHGLNELADAEQVYFCQTDSLQY